MSDRRTKAEIIESEQRLRGLLDEKRADATRHERKVVELEKKLQGMRDEIISNIDREAFAYDQCVKSMNGMFPYYQTGHWQTTDEEQRAVEEAIRRVLIAVAARYGFILS